MKKPNRFQIKYINGKMEKIKKFVMKQKYVNHLFTFNAVFTHILVIVTFAAVPHEATTNTVFLCHVQYI